jgi:isovaleryl-CoA dehydrogenase
MVPFDPTVNAPSLGAELDELRGVVRKFAEAEIAPLAESVDKDNQFPAAMWRKLGELGTLGATVPEQYGGSGLGYLAHLVTMEEISRASASVGLSYGAHSNLLVNNLHLNGTEAQRERYLPKLCSGEHVGALAMSEPGAGSDVVGSMACRAVRHGDVWVANGSKMWITNGPDADVLIVYMRTADADAGSKCVTAFIVEKSMAGFTTGPKLDKLGMRGSNTCELIFNDCEIPHENVLGDVNLGAHVLMRGLDSERTVLSGGPLGIMAAAFDSVIPYVSTRQQFGQPIGTFELMQGKLADMYVRLQSARSFAYQVARNLEAGLNVRMDAAACLLYASESAVQVALEAIQSLGGNGYINEYPTGRLLRDAKLYDIGAGTNEIRRMLIGREMLAAPRR